MKQATLYNYVDDNTLVFFAKTYSNLIGGTGEGSWSSFDLAKNNQMIANPKKISHNPFKK